MSDDLALLDELMPWSTAPLRLGRSWVLAPDAGSLRARWDALVRAGDATERAVLFRPSRSRTLYSAVGQLPGHPAPTGRLLRESGPCPPPVRVRYGALDRQWLIPDQRLIDAARPELWRVADHRQLFVVEQPAVPGAAVVASALLPAAPGGAPADGRPQVHRGGRIRPLFRRPDGREPNVAPGLLELLGERLGKRVDAEEMAAWIVATARHAPGGPVVPLTCAAELWAAGVELGRETMRIHTRGSRDARRLRLPGGQRPYVRAPLPAHPDALAYDPEEETLWIGAGRISPVPPHAWDYPAAGVRVLDAWFGSRTARAEPGTLAAIGPAAWLREWTSDLLELITVLALLAELGPRRAELDRQLTLARPIGTRELHRAGVLPVARAARRPASVLDHREEGPEGQFALW